MQQTCLCSSYVRRARCQCSNALLPLSLSVRPLTGHPHAVWLTHSHPAAVHGMLCCPFVLRPFLPISSRLRAVPPRSPAAQLAWPVRPGWAARRMRQSLSRPRQPRDVHAVGVGSASSHVVGARRRRGARSLPIAHTGEFSLRCGGVLTWRSLSCACDRG